MAYYQYIWFARSAKAEIENAYRTTNATVLQAMSREFQRYAPLFADLRSPDCAGASGPSLESLLLREYGLYGPSGTAPGLISSVGVSSLEDPSTTRLLVPFAAEAERPPSWRTGPSAYAQPVPDSARKQLADGRLIICEGQTGEERQFVIAPAARGLLVIVEIDVEGFFESYTKPAVAAVLPQARIEWASEPGDDRPSPDENGIQAFEPFRALGGGATESGRTFTIVVPAGVDSFVPRGPVEFDAPTPAPPNDGSYRPLDRNVGQGPRGAFRMLAAKIVLPPGSSIGSLEVRLSLDWLASELLLVGLCFACIQALLQKRKLSVMRQREREFVASVTHELRTPVTAIRSAADNMRRGLVGPERMAPYGEMIHSQALRLGSMIEEVLVFSQVEGGARLEPRLSRIEPAELFEELGAPFDTIAKSEGAQLSWDCSALPKSLLCDVETLRLCVSNLVANALYHAYPQDRAGEVRVICSIERPGFLRIAVEDDGRGIPKAEAGLVFEAFYRDEASRERHERGSGLGLFIARRKAQLAGGQLRLESPYARGEGPKRPGCRFSLELPIKENEDAR